MVRKFDRHALVARRPAAARSLLEWFAQILRHYVRDTSAVRELSQSASAELFERLKRAPQASTRQVERWTRNSAINALRRALRRQRRQALELESELHAAPDPDPEALLAMRQKIERLDAALARLRPLDQDALAAKVLGHTDAEIADQLQTTTGTIRSSVSRTRATLRLELTKQECRETFRQIIREARARQHDHERLMAPRVAESSSG